MNPFKLTDQEIDDLAIKTGTYPKDADQETVLRWRETYRKVEAESNQKIEAAGGLTAWYESGEGRLINMDNEDDVEDLKEELRQSK